MIAHLIGVLFFSSDRFVIIDVHGVGYKVRVPIDTVRIIHTNTNKEVSLWIHTVVREDALDLYGFINEAELGFFEMLISVSGIGPKTALGILNLASVDHIKEAVARGDANALTKVVGIGSKNAQKIILELKDKLTGYTNITENTMLNEERDAIEGLVTLGYQERGAREILQKIPNEIKGTSARIKEALKFIKR